MKMRGNIYVEKIFMEEGNKKSLQCNRRFRRHICQLSYKKSRCKGTKIAISGHLHSGSYTNKDGVKVYNVNIVVEQHEFAESKRDQTSGGNAGEIDMDTEFLDISKMSEEELPFR